ncbi:hypothetical protein E5345_12220 [Propionibacterium sp. NM47_B9-13]|uniref:Uncharacterized protein n=2 Tax=Cutibacterium modestum TaxID=2559073 RepID=A0AAD1KQP4_9ACTN|nr:hypothetical protein [Cutibacterium modestum]TGY27715.1 hypothetical protein E5345_12220 [Propionibacterium sp. NM47_B9-13]AOH46469.1 hypothetical protein BCB70_11745 [Cutibacterium modestum]EFS74696.1 hypothetical protein HMPREF9621_00973 [Cutibacterium modestum HL037PA2]EFS93259.1 hypothetical protein HMPREF9607_00471 [Cutibacterium modestum HL044PA1]EFT15586.1 hypothetical protein HMPREF9622_01361 [Cutibacterium modestum HL037PA3]
MAFTHRNGDPDDIYYGLTDRGPNTDADAGSVKAVKRLRFGINGIVKGSKNPFQLVEKHFGTDESRQDIGESMKVRMDSVPSSVHGAGYRKAELSTTDSTVDAHNLEPDTSYAVTTPVPSANRQLPHTGV